MATSATRSITITFTGDVNNTFVEPAATNAASPGQTELRTLSSGDNTITPPTGGSTPVSVTIIPPPGNVQAIKLKGVGGDTGVTLHLTDPSSIGLGNSAGTFILNAGGTITGLRLIWT